MNYDRTLNYKEMRLSFLILLFSLVGLSAIAQKQTKQDADFGPDSLYGIISD